ncbi:hypothetical protein YW7DRAFT_05165 [Streptomyces sp. AmelKG-E11A]|nr:hypothetical protein YW7DRAFT_05165 [Streptomyces sp. AmelKG-E11A]
MQGTGGGSGRRCSPAGSPRRSGPRSRVPSHASQRSSNEQQPGSAPTKPPPPPLSPPTPDEESTFRAFIAIRTTDIPRKPPDERKHDAP